MHDLQLLLASSGRILMGALFVWAAWMDYQQRQFLQQMMKDKNIPQTPFLFFGAVLLKFVGGLALVLNFYTPLAAFLLAGFMLIATIIFHGFWRETGPKREYEKVMFLTHLLLMGGLLALMSCP